MKTVFHGGGGRDAEVVDNNMNYQRTCLLFLECPAEVSPPPCFPPGDTGSNAFILHHICIDACASLCEHLVCS